MAKKLLCFLFVAALALPVVGTGCSTGVDSSVSVPEGAAPEPDSAPAQDANAMAPDESPPPPPK